MLRLSFSRIIRRTDSTKLGRPIPNKRPDGSQHQVIHFGPRKRTITSGDSQTDSFIKTADDHHNICSNRHPRTSSTSAGRANREHQPLTVMMTKSNDNTHVVLPTTPDLLRENRRKRRSLWSGKVPTTL